MEVEGRRTKVGGEVVVALQTRKEVEAAEVEYRSMEGVVLLVYWKVVREEHCCELVVAVEDLEQEQECFYRGLWVEAVVEAKVRRYLD